MSREEAFEKIRDILVSITEIDSAEIHEDSSMLDDLSLSSMEVLAVISEVEDAFGLKIPEKELRNFVTVGDLTEYAANR